MATVEQRAINMAYAGASPLDIAQFLGLTESTVLTYLADLTVDGASQEQRALSYIRAGHHADEVAQWLGVSTSTVFGWIADTATDPNTMWVPSSVVSATSPSGDTSGASDYTKIQAALTAATSAGGGQVLLRPGTFYINQTLVIGSGTRFDATGATIVLASGAVTNMFKNVAATPTVIATDGAMTSGQNTFTTASASQMSVGQTVVVFGAGSSGGSAQNTLVGYISNISGNTVTVGGGTLYPAPTASHTVSGATVWAITRDHDITIRGGIWNRTLETGQTSGGFPEINMELWRIDRLTLRDLTYNSTGGNRAFNIRSVTDSIVEGIRFPNAYSAGIQVNGPVDGLTIRDISGTTGDDMVAIVPLDWPTWVLGDEGNVTKVTIENVQPRAQAVGNAVKVLGGVGLTTTQVTVRGIKGSLTGTGTSGIPLWIGDDTSQANTTGGTLDQITAEDIKCSVNSAQQIVQINPSTQAGSIQLRDINVMSDAITLVNLNGSVNRLIIDGVTGQTATAGMANGVVLLNNSRPGKIGSQLILVNWDLELTANCSLVKAATSGSTLPELVLSNMRVGHVANIDLITSTTIRASNVHLLNNGGVLNVRSPAVVVVAGWYGCTADNTSSTITSTGTVESLARDFVLDINNAQVVKNNGDRCTARVAAGTIAAGQSVEYVTATAHWYDIRGNSL